MAVISNIVNLSVGYYLVYHTSYGFHGAAIGRMLGHITLPTLLIPYIVASGIHKNFWPGWNLKEAVQGIGAFLSLGVPGLFMIAMNWWAFEILAMMAGNLPNAVLALSAHAVIAQVSGAFYTVYSGIAVATTIRVGTCLGANRPAKAKLIACIAVSICFTASLFFSLCVIIFRNKIPKIFINDPQAVELASEALIVYALYTLVDGSSAVVKGVCRGTGKQNVAAYIVAPIYYAIGLPLAILLAFYFDWGVCGLWIAFAIANFLFLILCAPKLLHANWQSIANEGLARAI
jgi:MATE family multidrug resistance protein